MSLSSALCRPTSSATRVDASVRRERGRGMDAAGLLERPPGVHGAPPAASPGVAASTTNRSCAGAVGDAHVDGLDRSLAADAAAGGRVGVAPQGLGVEYGRRCQLDADHVLGRRRARSPRPADSMMPSVWRNPSARAASSPGVRMVTATSVSIRASAGPWMSRICSGSSIETTSRARAGDTVRDDIDLHARDAVRGSRVRTGELHASRRQVPALPAPPPEPRTPPARSNDGWPAGPRLR